MKLGDMTFNKIAEICTNHECNSCPFYNNSTIINCLLHKYLPAHQNLDIEVKTDAEDQS